MLRMSTKYAGVVMSQSCKTDEHWLYIVQLFVPGGIIES